MKSFLRAFPKNWVCMLVAITMLSSCVNELKLVKIHSADPVYVKKHDLKKSTENVTAAVTDAKQTNEVILAANTETSNTTQVTETPDASSTSIVSTQTVKSVGAETKTTRQLVKEKMAENVVLSALPAQAQQKMENFVVKKVEKIEAKQKAKAAAAAAPSIINREFTIGLILLLAGILLGVVVNGTLGGIVSVVGIVLMVIGLIHGV